MQCHHTQIGKKSNRKNYDFPITDNEQQNMSVFYDDDKKKQETMDVEKQYIEIEDMIDEGYKQKKLSEQGPTKPCSSFGKKKKAQEREARIGMTIAPAALPFPHRQSKSEEDDGKIQEVS